MSKSNPDVVFRSFDPQAELAVTARNLPHWFQTGAAMLITFRTADSMPVDVLIRWQQELEHWLRTNKLPIELAASTAVKKSLDHEQLLSVFECQSTASVQEVVRSALSPIAGRLPWSLLTEAKGTGGDRGQRGVVLRRRQIRPRPICCDAQPRARDCAISPWSEIGRGRSKLAPLYRSANQCGDWRFGIVLAAGAFRSLD